MRAALYAVAATCATAAPASMSDAARLRSLGYRASEIAAIRPTVASVVARRGLPRPFVCGVLLCRLHSIDASARWRLLDACR